MQSVAFLIWNDLFATQPLAPTALPLKCHVIILIGHGQPNQLKQSSYNG